MSDYKRNEFIEFAQLFIHDEETISIPNKPRTIPTSDGRWVEGWFKVTPKMVDRYRLAYEEPSME